MECVPASLKTVLNEVSARFGPLTIVSTTHLQTDNHVSGSDRAKLHAACKAVDFRIEGPATDEVLRYLRGRRGIAGLTSYRGGLIHIDANGNNTPSPPAADLGSLTALRGCRDFRGGDRTPRQLLVALQPSIAAAVLEVKRR